jgi:hypothetical protein
VKGSGAYDDMDENGMQHTWILPDLYYCPTTSYRIISPQHLDKCWIGDNIGTFFEATSSEGKIIQWTTPNGKEFFKVLKHNTKSGVPVLEAFPNVQSYCKYIKTKKVKSPSKETRLGCAAAHVIPPDDDDIQTQQNHGNVHHHLLPC